MLAKLGRRLLAACSLWFRTYACGSKLRVRLIPDLWLRSNLCSTSCPKIPDPLLHPLDKSSVHNGSGIMGGVSAPDLKFLADLKTSTKSAELCKFFYMIHAKRVGRAKHFFIVDLVPFILVLFWKVHWSNISFT